MAVGTQLRGDRFDEPRANPDRVASAARNDGGVSPLNFGVRAGVAACNFLPSQGLAHSTGSDRRKGWQERAVGAPAAAALPAAGVGVAAAGVGWNAAPAVRVWFRPIVILPGCLPCLAPAAFLGVWSLD